MGSVPQFTGNSRTPTGSIFQQFQYLVKDIVASATVFWPSQVLEDKRVTSISEASRIIKSTLHDTKWQRELHALLTELGGVQSPRLWDLYFRSYDKAVVFSDGYLDLIGRANRLIPTSGTILDLGCGTGNFSSALLLGEPKRKVLALDTSAQGLKVSAKKLAAVSRVRGGTFELRTMDIRTLGATQTSVQGVVMNNVLYTLSAKSRKSLLKQIFKVLDYGAPLFLNDPLPAVQEKTENVERLLTKLFADAILNGSPLTEFDVALIAFVNHQTLVGRTPTFLTSREMSDLALETGFQIVARDSAYYGVTTCLSLRKPVLPGRRTHR